MFILPCLFVDLSAKGGRGVFTNEDIPEETLIEISPVLVLSPRDMEIIHSTKLHDYYFLWGENDDHAGILLGFGSLYNHSYTPNVQYSPDYDTDTMDFMTLRPVKAGEELLINYSGDPEGRMKLWFEIG